LCANVVKAIIHLKTEAMSDNKTKQDGRDDSKIDAHDSSEVSYAAKEFGVTAAQVKEAVEAVGSSRAKVKEYLAGK
jgi:hypothetical protein